MTVIKPADFGYGYYTPSPVTIVEAIAICFLEIVVPLLIYEVFARERFRSGSTTTKNEIGAFVISFVVALILLNPLWLIVMSLLTPYRGTWSALLATVPLIFLACVAEIAVSVLVYYLRYGPSWNEPTDARTGITRFIIIFIAVFAIINTVWIEAWAIGWP